MIPPWSEVTLRSGSQLTQPSVALTPTKVEWSLAPTAYGLTFKAEETAATMGLGEFKFGLRKADTSSNPSKLCG